MIFRPWLRVSEGEGSKQGGRSQERLECLLKYELRLRVIGESHTALQMLRERLNSSSKVEYANYFPGHPELDDPEFYIRTTGKNSSEKVLKEIVSGLAKEFSSISL